MPKILKIITHPDPRLRKKSPEIELEKINQLEIQQLLLDMEKTMLEKDGAGLAAPQIGKNIRLIVINHKNKTFFLINPQITKKSWAREIDDEGCLSVLDEKGDIIYAPVERYKKVNCIYWDEKGNRKKISAEKILARIIQHEIDHLDGVLFIDRIVARNRK